MATNNKRIKVGELDFDGIKENLKNYLKSQTQFQDYNFEGSGLSVLLDVLAYNTHYNAVYTNLAINEMFLDTASKRSSVVSLAKMLGYVPRSSKCAIARVNIRVVPTNNSPSPFVSLPSLSSFATSVNDDSYLFYTRESYSARLDAGAYTFNNVELYEGTPLDYTFEFQDDIRFIIPNDKIDTSTLRVRVQESSTGAFTTYNYSNEITSVEKESRVFFLKEVEENKYEIYFGDGIIGYKPANGNRVQVDYFRCSESAVNGANTFTLQGSISSVGQVSITTTQAASGGSSSESVESIRSNAPINYSAQNRAVTAEDYKVILPQLYSNIETISVWGGEENDPPVYGKVFICVKPLTGEALTPETKESIKRDVLKNKNVVSIIPELVDPEYLRILITSTIYYNPIVTVSGASTIETFVRNAIIDFNRRDLNKFDSVMRFSRLSKIIDAAEEGIVNNITSIRLQKSIVPSFNRVQTYTISINNPIYTETGISASVVSSGFTIPGSTFTFFIEDNGSGLLRRYSVTSAGQKIIAPGFVGTVDYETGKIQVQSLNITSADDNQLSFTIRPASNDVVSVRNQLATIDENQIVLKAIEDRVSSGETTAGNYVFTTNSNQ
jgi:hypothetical protein